MSSMLRQKSKMRPAVFRQSPGAAPFGFKCEVFASLFLRALCAPLSAYSVLNLFLNPQPPSIGCRTLRF